MKNIRGAIRKLEIMKKGMVKEINAHLFPYKGARDGAVEKLEELAKAASHREKPHNIKNKPHLSLETNNPNRRRAGEDEMGLGYMETLSTAEDEVHNTTCPICHKHVDKGFLCLDGGEVYHNECVVIIDA